MAAFDLGGGRAASTLRIVTRATTRAMAARTSAGLLVTVSVTRRTATARTCSQRSESGTRARGRAQVWCGAGARAESFLARVELAALVAGSSAGRSVAAGGGLKLTTAAVASALVAVPAATPVAVASGCAAGSLWLKTTGIVIVTVTAGAGGGAGAGAGVAGAGAAGSGSASLTTSLGGVVGSPAGGVVGAGAVSGAGVASSAWSLSAGSLAGGLDPSAGGSCRCGLGGFRRLRLWLRLRLGFRLGLGSGSVVAGGAAGGGAAAAGGSEVSAGAASAASAD